MDDLKATSRKGDAAALPDAPAVLVDDQRGTDVVPMEILGASSLMVLSEFGGEDNLEVQSDRSYQRNSLDRQRNLRAGGCLSGHWHRGGRESGLPRSRLCASVAGHAGQRCAGAGAHADPSLEPENLRARQCSECWLSAVDRDPALVATPECNNPLSKACRARFRAALLTSVLRSDG